MVGLLRQAGHHPAKMAHMPREWVEFLLSALGEVSKRQSHLDFVREDYTIKKEFLGDIEERFGVKIQRDCFAAPHNARCGKFFTKKDDALHQNWETGEVLWLNPPWSLWPKVAKKLKKERCTAICLCPDWEKEWVRKLFRLVTKKFRFEEGTELFEVNGKSMEGIRWGVWALLVEGGASPEKSPELRNVVTLNARMLKEKYPAGGARKVGKERQLLLKTDVELRNGDIQKMDILVDTGAEANLIRKGLISNHLTYVARKPLKFATANGQSLGGGTPV
jgi:hypothetical protein